MRIQCNLGALLAKKVDRRISNRFTVPTLRSQLEMNSRGTQVDLNYVHPDTPRQGFRAQDGGHAHEGMLNGLGSIQRSKQPADNQRQGK
jgi:hypothetical protein